MDPRIINGALALVAVAALVASNFADGESSRALLGLGMLVAGWVGLRRPGDLPPGRRR